jgi:hypothetical protein
MQYFQHSHQTKFSKPRREVRQVGPDETPPVKEWKELKKQVGDLQKGMSASEGTQRPDALTKETAPVWRQETGRLLQVRGSRTF